MNDAVLAHEDVPTRDMLHIGPATVPDAGTDRYLTVHGLRLHYRDWGDPDAVPVLILHGLMGHAREWDVLTATLAARFRVIAMDQRGHGESDWAADYAASRLTDDAIGLIEALGLPRVCVVGHSLGGMVGLLCAADRPDLVERLVVVDIGPDSVSSDWAAQELSGTLHAMAASSYPDVEQAVRQWATGNPLAQEPLLRHYVRHCLVPRADGRLVWRFDAAGLSRFGTDGVSESQLWDAIDRVAAPTLVIRGEHSPLLSRPTTEQMVGRLANGQFAQVAGAGHDLGVEQPQAVAQLTSDFLRT